MYDKTACHYYSLIAKPHIPGTFEMVWSWQITGITYIQIYSRKKLFCTFKETQAVCLLGWLNTEQLIAKVA